MRGLMMNTPLLITSIMRHAEQNYPNREIVSAQADGSRHRYTYADAFRRARRLANALQRLGLERGDRIATLAWNDHRHFEIYYATSCSGYVCHTINPRLFPEQIDYIVNHAEDRWIFTDPTFVPALENLQPSLPGVLGYVVLTDEAHMPDTNLANAVSYEKLIEQEPDAFEWPELDEYDASGLCYTSGTTGNPKGVLYHHRAMVLHTYAAVMPDVFGLTNRDTVLPIVPMFHANAWGIPYLAPMVGAKLVLPAAKGADPETLHALIEDEAVTLTAAVPTVWLGLLAYLDKQDKRIDSLQRLVVGGAAPPLALIKELEERYDVRVHPAWGMTEMSPLGTLNTPTAATAELTGAAKEALQVKAGRAVCGVEMRLVDDDDVELPWDGETSGRLLVRGPWVCSGYLKLDDSAAHTADGWLDTGDVATIDPNGFMQVTDRTKDLVKSGGEWISSIALENIIMAHAAVAEAAVIGVQHPEWGERPLLVVVRKTGAKVDKDELLAFYEGKVAKWWIPDDVVFVDDLPHTATGKVSKLRLRQKLTDFRRD
jgi:fatty-acyl-CoA synthase